MKRIFVLLSFILSASTVQAALNICPRMPIQAAVSNNFITAISAAGAVTTAQPAFTNLSGSAACAQLPALTGDLTSSSCATTFATVNSNVGSFGSASAVPVITVNAKGLVTAVSTSAVSVPTIPPTSERFTSPTTATYNLMYAFTITSGSATAAATYTNNGVTYTVYATVASATLVYMSGSGAPAASGTLTKASGTGDSTLTFSAYKAPVSLDVFLIGGGGGGACSGTAVGSCAAGTNGTSSTFGTGPLASAGGGGGVSWADPSGGTGGGVVITAPAVFVWGGTGGHGGGYFYNNGVLVYAFGPAGGGNCTGSSGGGGGNQAAIAASANTGQGGGGAGIGVAVNDYSGASGGAGACLMVNIPAPLNATYSYTVGDKGAGGTPGGTNGFAGASGGTGQIAVKSNFY